MPNDVAGVFNGGRGEHVFDQLDKILYVNEVIAGPVDGLEVFRSRGVAEKVVHYRDQVADIGGAVAVHIAVYFPENGPDAAQ